MSLILISTLISLGLLVLFAWLARKPEGIAKACWTSLGLTIVSVFSPVGLGPFIKPALFLQCLITFGVALVCLLIPKYPQVFRLGSLMAVVASYVLLLSPGIAELREVHRLREQFPLESLADRLAYEPHVQRTGRPVESASAAVLSPAVEKRLDDMEKRLDEQAIGDRSNYRRYSLMALHNDTRDDFVLARGFGRVRMRSVRPENITLPPPVPLESPPNLESPYDPETGSAIPQMAEAPGRPIPSGELLQMHYSGLGDFFSAERMGYVQDVQHVAGFQSHSFTKMPDFGSVSPSWKIVRLELISLLKHEQPVAYVSEHLPQMDQLKNARTRPLNGFEQDALGGLRSDEDVVIEDVGTHIQMVGSLRASKDCLQCHAVQRGALLGALTYRLMPSRNPAESSEQQQP